jgi:hypothetical protein
MERYPNSLVWVLAQVKDGDEQFWKEKFHAVNGKAQHSQIVQFFSCGHMGEGTGGGERDFLFFSLVPNVFPWGSHQVPKYVSQDVPNSTSVLSHIVCPKLSPCQLYRWAKGPHITSLHRNFHIG